MGLKPHCRRAILTVQRNGSSGTRSPARPAAGGQHTPVERGVVGHQRGGPVQERDEVAPGVLELGCVLDHLPRDPVDVSEQDPRPRRPDQETLPVDHGHGFDADETDRASVSGSWSAVSKSMATNVPSAGGSDMDLGGRRAGIVGLSLRVSRVSSVPYTATRRRRPRYPNSHRNSQNLPESMPAFLGPLVGAGSADTRRTCSPGDRCRGAVCSHRSSPSQHATAVHRVDVCTASRSQISSIFSSAANSAEV